MNPIEKIRLNPSDIRVYEGTAGLTFNFELDTTDLMEIWKTLLTEKSVSISLFVSKDAMTRTVVVRRTSNPDRYEI